MAQSAERLRTGWTVRGSIPGGGDVPQLSGQTAGALSASSYITSTGFLPRE